MQSVKDITITIDMTWIGVLSALISEARRDPGKISEINVLIERQTEGAGLPFVLNS